MKFDFTGKAAMVTGASVGIGRAAALKLAEGGADVALFDVNEEKLRQVLTETNRQHQVIYNETL